ncbi:MAG: 2-hydroxyacid dehydrogenase [Pseudomonadota bacterium]
MRIAVFSTKAYDRQFLDAANHDATHEFVYFEARLESSTASLAQGFAAVCVFVNDCVDAPVLEALAAGGTKVIALRCAGYNNVDLPCAARLGIQVVRVPAYSPHAVSEFTIGLLLALGRKICRASTRVRENNFALEGLLGRELHGKTAGVVGTGRIGSLVARALRLGFGCDVLAHDERADPALQAIGVRYLGMDELMRQSDIVTLHCPLTPVTRHMINADNIASGKNGFLLVNTSRGALVDAVALIAALKTGKVGGVALDVYEQESDLFFEDLSNEIIQDDVFQRLLTFPNVLLTGHQAFFTHEAMSAIAAITLYNLTQVETGELSENRLTASNYIESK